jgi:glycerol kinase
MSAILAIDQGTHASRAVVFDTAGRILAVAMQPVALRRLDAVQVEQNAVEILQSVRGVIDTVLENISVQVKSAGLATQRSTLVAWDRETGEPLAPAISWQDRRAANLLQPYADRAAAIHAITGLPLSPHYLAGKIKWLLENDRAVQAAFQSGRLCVGPLASFLCANLLCGKPHVVDHSNAARSLLFDLRRLDWSPDLLALFEIPRSILPECRPTLASYGSLIGHDIELCCVCGDQNAAIHAEGIPAADTALINIGSGAFVLQPAGANPPRHERLLGGIASSRDDHADYLLEGTVNGAGSAVDVMREQETEEEFRQLLTQWLAEVVDPPICINTIGGLGSPWWVDQAPMCFVPENADRAKRIVAIMESILFMLLDNLAEMARDSIQKIRISGGLSRLDGLCQRLADLAGIPVARTTDHEATARGVAWLALGSDQPWTQEQPELFTPRTNPALKRRYRHYRHVLLTSLGAKANWRREIEAIARQKKPPRIVAHRGYRGRHAENTLSAISAAIDSGADAVEFDIQFSRDAEPMIFHDETLARMTGEQGRIFDYSREQLKQFAILSAAEDLAKERIPDLGQVIEVMAAHPRVLFFAEVKRHTLDHFGIEKVMRRLLADLRDNGKHCILISFEHECLEYARRNSALAIGWVLREYDAAHRAAAERLLPDYLIVNHEKLTGEPPWPGPWDWMVYEINDRELAGQYYRLGVDWISTAAVSELKECH